jgi:hypothetical protein
MASHFYSRIAPDYGDLDNETKRCPGFVVGVTEHDGGVGLLMNGIDPKAKDFRGVFFTPDEAEEVIAALREAIDQAKRKIARGNAHPPRVRNE